MPLFTHPNPDLVVGPERQPRWNLAACRRASFHGLQHVARYSQSYRAGRVLDLRVSADLAIPAREDLRRLTALPWFSAMAVTEGNRLLHESYATDFGPDRPHSIMSISKLAMHLAVGRLWEEGKLGLDEQVGDILPWIGPGYRTATLQEVLDMNVHNTFDEDYANPDSAAFLREAAIGMRLPVGEELTSRGFLAGIGLVEGARDSCNPTDTYLYKSANTDVLALVVEARGGRSLGLWLADLADAAGVEAALLIGTDRTGFPVFSGGMCLTARDLCRYGAILARRGVGADGVPFGSAAFLTRTLGGGIPMPAPRAHLRYSNQTNTDGIWVGHGGYGGQYLVANPETGRTACFLSVLQNDSGFDADYYPPIISMLAEICAAC